MLFRYLKVLVFLSISWIIFSFTMTHIESIWKDLVYYIIFPGLFIFINYIFIKLVLWYIKYYNDLLVIHNWKIIVIKSSLLFKDNIEFIDISKITKLDTYLEWIVQNILWFWKLVAEQQREEVRKFHYVPRPARAMSIINKEKQKVLEDRKNTYIVSDDN